MSRTPLAQWVCCYAAAADIEAARDHAYQWNQERFGGDRGGTRDEQLPTAVSPTGTGPPTGYLCVFAATPAIVEAVIAFVAEHNSPIEIVLQDKDAFLAARGLAEIHHDHVDHD